MTGHITTIDKQWLTFAVGDCKGFTPAVGQRVAIERVEGMDACGLNLLAEAPVQAYDPEDKYGLFQLTVLLDRKLPEDRAALATLLGGDVTSVQRSPHEPIDVMTLERGRHGFILHHVHLPFPETHMDLRKLAAPLRPGVAYVGIIPVYALSGVEGRLMLGPDFRDPWAPRGACA
jgi:hypothetical protein